MRKLLLFIVPVSILSCTPKTKAEFVKISGFTQGTNYNITYENTVNKDITTEIDSLLHHFDLSLSEYNPASIISGINANKPGIEIDNHFRKVFEMSAYIWKETNGAMDITVGPVIDALGFGPSARIKVDSAKIKSLLKYVGMQKVQIKGNKVIKADTAVKLDVNSIAQGYSVDVVSEYIEQLGIKNYMVEIGGEVRTKGKNPKGNVWRIGIDKPEDGNMIPGNKLQEVINLNSKAITTSGNYRKFYEENGVKYSHIINPKTGFPVRSRLLSVTVVAQNCITADGWDTALMVLGLEESIKLLAKHPELDAYLIYSGDKGEYKVYMTEGMKKIIDKQ